MVPSPATQFAPEAPQHEPTTEGRDARGRFTKNNRGGPGNPFARRVAALRQVLLDTVTDDDIHAITAELIAQAREGDLAATKLLFAYAIGKPTNYGRSGHARRAGVAALSAGPRHGRRTASGAGRPAHAVGL